MSDARVAAQQQHDAFITHTISRDEQTDDVAAREKQIRTTTSFSCHTQAERLFHYKDITKNRTRRLIIPRSSLNLFKISVSKQHARQRHTIALR